LLTRRYKLLDEPTQLTPTTACAKYGSDALLAAAEITGYGSSSSTT